MAHSHTVHTVDRTVVRHETNHLGDYHVKHEVWYDHYAGEYYLTVFDGYGNPEFEGMTWHKRYSEPLGDCYESAILEAVTCYATQPKGGEELTNIVVDYTV